MAHLSLDEITPEKISVAAGIPSGEAEALHAGLRRVLRELHGSRGGGPDAWRSISRELLSPDLPFAFHQMMYYGCYRDRPSGAPPPPAWFPDDLRSCHMLARKHGHGVRHAKRGSSWFGIAAALTAVEADFNSSLPIDSRSCP